MAEPKTPPKKEEKPKGFLGKLKEAAEDKEEQIIDQNERFIRSAKV